MAGERAAELARINAALASEHARIDAIRNAELARIDARAEAERAAVLARYARAMIRIDGQVQQQSQPRAQSHRQARLQEEPNVPQPGTSSWLGSRKSQGGRRHKQTHKRMHKRAHKQTHKQTHKQAHRR